MLGGALHSNKYFLIITQPHPSQQYVDTTQPLHLSTCPLLLRYCCISYSPIYPHLDKK